MIGQGRFSSLRNIDEMKSAAGRNILLKTGSLSSVRNFDKGRPYVLRRIEGSVNKSRNFYLEHTCPKSLPLNVDPDGAHSLAKSLAIA
jgi:hypothetical protein